MKNSEKDLKMMDWLDRYFKNREAIKPLEEESRLLMEELKEFNDRHGFVSKLTEEVESAFSTIRNFITELKEKNEKEIIKYESSH
jgi:hypothetical protein